jgi:hypothetical protein
MYYNHLSIGNVKLVHKDRTIVTSLNSEQFDQFLNSIDTYEYEVVHIPPGWEHRADLISNLFYDSPKYDWLILWFNNISDPLQQLNVGDRLLIPAINDA